MADINFKDKDKDFDGARRIFYRIISCGLGPNQNYIVPMQAYFSIGGERWRH